MSNLSIYEKLSKVQVELKAPKGQYNSFGKYKYRSCEDIVEALKPVLFSNGLVFYIKDEIVMIGTRFYVKATVVLTDIESNQALEITAYAREEESKKGMDGSQVTGASSSYARKYALNGLFGIDDTKDSDATNTEGSGSATPPKPPKPAVNPIFETRNRIMKELIDVMMSEGVEKTSIVAVIKSLHSENGKPSPNFATIAEESVYSNVMAHLNDLREKNKQ